MYIFIIQPTDKFVMELGSPSHNEEPSPASALPVATSSPPPEPSRLSPEAATSSSPPPEPSRLSPEAATSSPPPEPSRLSPEAATSSSPPEAATCTSEQQSSPPPEPSPLPSDQHTSPSSPILISDNEVSKVTCTCKCKQLCVICANSCLQNFSSSSMRSDDSEVNIRGSENILTVSINVNSVGASIQTSPTRSCVCVTVLR